jgi:peptide deformylase
MPGVDEVIRRSNRVHLTYTDLDEESHTIVADGVLSQALQHEMDHLNGQVIAQRLPSFRRSTLRKRMESLTEKMRKLGVSYMDVVEGRRPS